MTNVPEERQSLPKFVIFAVIVLAALVIILVFIIGSRQPSSSTQDGSIQFVQVTQQFIPGKDLTINVGNVAVYVPEDATTLEGTVSVIQREPNLFSDESFPGWVRPEVVNVEYLNGEGIPYPQLAFSKTIQICFKFAVERWLAYQRNPDGYQIQYYAEEQDPPVWLPIQMWASQVNLRLCGETYYPSLFALAIWQEGAGSVPGETATPVRNPPGPIPPATPRGVYEP